MSAAKWFSAAFAPLLWFAPLAANGQETLPAFPGAEGFGAASVGGRGGRVIKVTNLNASGPGSLQAACEAKGPRIVVFEVSGVIRGDVVIKDSSITIAGQTAPGAGITVVGMIASLFSNWDKPVGDPSRHMFHDMTIRHLRVRPPGPRGSSGDCLQFSDVDRLILDHISCSWGSDENVDLCSSRDVTVQWCTIEESSTQDHPKGRHNFGLICGPGHHVSIHHNYFVHHARRCPAVRNGPADIRNNVVYNFRDGYSHEGGATDTGFNLVGNYYKAGPNDAQIFPFCMSGKVRYHLRDNSIDGVGMIQDPWAEASKLYGLQYYAGRGLGTKAEEEFPVPKVTTQLPEEACTLVLRGAGCLPRDVVTTRCVKDFQEGTGAWGVRLPADLMEGLEHGDRAKPWADSDADGMPDVWEQVHHLDASADDHNERMPSGYTAVEEYCNEMASWRIVGSPEGKCPAGGSLEFSLLTPKAGR